MVIEEAVTIGKACGKVGQWRLLCDAQWCTVKVFGLHATACLCGSKAFVGRFLVDFVPSERLEVAVEVHAVVAGGDVCRELPFHGSVLHDEVHSTTDAVALHVGSKALGHFQSVEHLTRKDVKRNETVLVVGAGNLHAIYQRIIIAFIHTAQNGILPFTAGVAFHRDTAHALDDVGHGNVRRQLDGFRAHHVHHVQGVLLNEARPGFGSSRIVCRDGHAFQLDFFRHERNFDVLVIRTHLHFEWLVTHVSAD